jgi:hypothetical protein
MVVLGTTIHESAPASHNRRHPLNRHPGLEPGSIPQSHERLIDGPRLKAGVTIMFGTIIGALPAARRCCTMKLVDGRAKHDHDDWSKQQTRTDA